MNPRELDIEDFDYNLPDELIARHPLEQRDRCRLLVRHSNGELEERIFCDLPELLPADTLLIANNTRVINARLQFHKPGSGARIEIFCLEPENPSDYEQSFASTSECSWICFVGNSKRWKSGTLTMILDINGREVELCAERIAKEGNASVIKFRWSDSSVTFSSIIQAAGEIPIPPYLNRSTEQSDSQDYQTVYSRIEGSVAAPTAGLHFTPELFASLKNKGIECRELTLHVGAGTFAPVKSDTVGDHEMHSEFISVEKNLIKKLAEQNSTVIAVGTTSVRTLESLYHLGCMCSQDKIPDEVPQWYPYSAGHPDIPVAESMKNLLDYLQSNGLDKLVAATRIIIAPGYKYRIVKGMVTNFHQPKSTLLLLVSAFTGGDWRRMYDYAVQSGFRFLSYGDAELLL
ncbi:MAG: S-adenosylmethionine:tRNA ribosyltransferase-isomerase [Paramuribaculum sp.]|nr:S-adenosylmethionine:tRNA ribosyltransferase-isomerase [Paramuribaculum sp.]